MVTEFGTVLPTRRRRWWIFGLATALCVGAAVWFVSDLWQRPLPQIESIESMEAWLLEENSGSKFQFRVPQEHWRKIYTTLLPARRDHHALKWAVLGGLELTLWDGSKTVVALYGLPADSDGAFSTPPVNAQRRYFRGGNSADLRAALRAAYEAAQDR